MTALGSAQPPAVAYVPVDRLVFHPRNVRTDLGDLRELSASIRELGVLQPLVVERRPGAQVLRVLAGHRRLAAARLAGLRKVPCVLIGEHEDDQAITLMLAENLQRAGLSAKERRDAVVALIEEFEYTPQGVADRLGVHLTTVYGWLRQAERAAAAEPGSKTPPTWRRNKPHPRIKPTAIVQLLDNWRRAATAGLTAEEAATLLGELEALLDGWRPEPSSTSVNPGIVASVEELDPHGSRPVRELANRLGVHPKLIERARCRLTRELKVREAVPR